VKLFSTGALVVAALASFPPIAGAQTPIPYMTVDEVAVSDRSISVTGVVQGSTTPSVHTYTPPYGDQQLQLERCHRQLLLALSKPGQYVARIGGYTCAIALVAP
jgi:hypothetical protein